MLSKKVGWPPVPKERARGMYLFMNEKYLCCPVYAIYI
jgi:hypothetical protein